MQSFKTYLILACICISNALNSAVITVRPGDDLGAAIRNASGGDIILVKAGVYPELSITDKKFTASAPLIIRGEKKGSVIRKNQVSAGSALKMFNCSYVVIENLVIEGGMWGLFVESSDHIILQGNEVRNVGQEGIKVRYRSMYVDVLDNYIHHTGLYNSDWGEMIYIGTGAVKQTPFPDTTQYVWIENNRMHDGGNGEGINIKSPCFHITVKGNTIYNIYPGTCRQYNQGGIAVDGGMKWQREVADKLSDVWIEQNKVYRVVPDSVRYQLGVKYSNPDSCQHCNGIEFSETGVFVVNNTVYACDGHGIYANGWGGISYECVVYNNKVKDVKGKPLQYAFKVKETNPGPNPNKPQTWYKEYLKKSKK